MLILNYGMLINECEIFYKEQIPTLMDDDSVGGFVEREFDDRISRFRGEELRLRRMVFAQRLLGESIISGADTMFDVVSQRSRLLPKTCPAFITSFLLGSKQSCTS